MTKKPFTKNAYVKTMQVAKGTPPTILNALPSVGLAVYDNNTKCYYLSNVISEVAQLNRAEKTAEKLLKLIKQDITDFSGLHSILVGDGIFDDEYNDETIEKEFSCYEDCWRAHQEYRREIQEYLQTEGFKHIHPFFCEQRNSWSRISLNTTEGRAVMQEFDLSTKVVHLTVFFEFPYDEKRIRRYYNNK